MTTATYPMVPSFKGRLYSWYCYPGRLSLVAFVTLVVGWLAGIQFGQFPPDITAAGWVAIVSGIVSLHATWLVHMLAVASISKPEGQELLQLSDADDIRRDASPNVRFFIKVRFVWVALQIATGATSLIALMAMLW